MNLKIGSLWPARLSGHGTQFSEWRAVRPFLGGVLLALGGVTIVANSTVLAAGPASFAGLTMIGFVAAVVMFLCGTFALAEPPLAGILGVVGVISAIVSLVGTMPGAFVGILLSLVGGNLCRAWQPDDAEN